jgi:hypothetical protein
VWGGVSASLLVAKLRCDPAGDGAADGVAEQEHAQRDLVAFGE